MVINTTTKWQAAFPAKGCSWFKNASKKRCVVTICSVLLRSYPWIRLQSLISIWWQPRASTNRNRTSKMDESQEITCYIHRLFFTIVHLSLAIVSKLVEEDILWLTAGNSVNAWSQKVVDNRDGRFFLSSAGFILTVCGFMSLRVEKIIKCWTSHISKKQYFWYPELSGVCVTEHDSGDIVWLILWGDSSLIHHINRVKSHPRKPMIGNFWGQSTKLELFYPYRV